jgi:hypothetical protein
MAVKKEVVVTDSTGSRVFNPSALIHSYHTDADGNLLADTVQDHGDFFTKAYAYENGNLVAESAWVWSSDVPGFWISALVQHARVMAANRGAPAGAPVDAPVFAAVVAAQAVEEQAVEVDAPAEAVAVEAEDGEQVEAPVVAVEAETVATPSAEVAEVPVEVDAVEDVQGAEVAALGEAVAVAVRPSILQRLTARVASWFRK